MGMIASFISEYSSFKYIKIIVSLRIFLQHPGIQSHHQLLILFRSMFTSTIFPHHISDSSSFSYSEMFYVAIAFCISSFYLSYNR